MLTCLIVGLSKSAVYGAGWENTWVYIQENGDKAIGWQQLEWDGKENWYYFDSMGQMQTGWHLIDGNWYYFFPSGEMADGEIELLGDLVEFKDGALVDQPNDKKSREIRFCIEGRTEQEISEAETKIQEAILFCSQGENNYEKAYQLCEWIGENLIYDAAGPYDVVGVLNAGGTICEGYTMVYREIASRMGFYCERVASKQMNHSWNYIVVEGVGYYTDATWDDAGRKSYNLLSKEEIQKTHVLEAPQHK